ncbi:MAG TPA: nitroreductase family protein [Candidatus Dependentiae bacterium]|nr:nitroreductase family protein [Candidatus Dependentiae bacterium]HRQ63050.1 nitroreductase family protein [Candidatus Dependentiae bacterium]
MTYRKPDYPIHDIILHRWSPRAMSGEPISDAELMTLFEAARWAPSSFNNQPWRFVYAKKDTPAWDIFFDLLNDSNKKWAQHAAVLLVIASCDTFEYSGKYSRTHSFDTGAAWENLALQGTINNLAVRGMEGFSYERAKRRLNIPDGYTVEAMAAIGKPGNKEELPADLQEKEKPSMRKNITEFVFEGAFK